MAVGKKTGGRDFAPGLATPGPGRPRALREMCGYPDFNRDDLAKITTRLLSMTRGELDLHLGRRTTPNIELVLGAIILRAIEAGDHLRAGFVFHRLLGLGQRRALSKPEQAKNQPTKDLPTTLEELEALEASESAATPTLGIDGDEGDRATA